MARRKEKKIPKSWGCEEIAQFCQEQEDLGWKIVVVILEKD